MITLYLLATIALFISTAAIYMALIPVFPVQWLYYHYFIRKPLVWALFGVGLYWVARTTLGTGSIIPEAAIPLGLLGLAVILTYRMHQDHAFPAVDYPDMSEDPQELPLSDTMQLAVIEYGGETKAYPLDYVVHHHIVNDSFGDHIVSLTYCAMCRSIIPFDVTDIGPLFVGSFKNANMIVADRRTKTFFQQATFESLIGQLHPRALTMIPFQILPWSEVRRLDNLPKVCRVTADELHEFQLPIPGVWKKIMASEATPGLSKDQRDDSLPVRTHVIGTIDPATTPQVVYIKSELIRQGVVKNQELNTFFVAVGDTVSAFRGRVAGESIDLVVGEDYVLSDQSSGTVWSIRGKYLSGPIESDLESVAISDEYWFAWKEFHPDSKLIRLDIADG